MPAAYSAEIRSRVIASVESGSSRREAAEEFDVSASSAIKWVAAYRTTGICTAKPRGGSTSPLEKYANFLLTLIEVQPDLTLDEVVCAMHLDRVQVRRIFGQIAKHRTARFDRLTDTGGLVGRKIVDHDDIPALEGRGETPLDIGQEFLSSH